MQTKLPILTGPSLMRIKCISPFSSFFQILLSLQAHPTLQGDVCCYGGTNRSACRQRISRWFEDQDQRSQAKDWRSDACCFKQKIKNLLDARAKYLGRQTYVIYLITR